MPNDFVIFTNDEVFAMRKPWSYSLVGWFLRGPSDDGGGVLYCVATLKSSIPISSYEPSKRFLLIVVLFKQWHIESDFGGPMVRVKTSLAPCRTWERMPFVRKGDGDRGVVLMCTSFAWEPEQWWGDLACYLDLLCFHKDRNKFLFLSTPKETSKQMSLTLVGLWYVDGAHGPREEYDFSFLLLFILDDNYRLELQEFGS